MNSRMLGLAMKPGRNPVPAQIPHTTKAPKIAPLLFPLPPTINMAQITNVAYKGSKEIGYTNLILWAYNAPPIPIIAAPNIKAWSLKLRTFLPLA